MVLEGPSGEHYESAMGVDAFDARDRYVDIRPPSPFDMISMESVVQILKRREMRPDLLAKSCEALGRKLAQDMQDAEGWHDASRIEPMKRSLAGKS